MIDDGTDYEVDETAFEERIANLRQQLLGTQQHHKHNESTRNDHVDTSTVEIAELKDVQVQTETNKTTSQRVQTETYSEKCSECQQLKSELQDITEKFDSQQKKLNELECDMQRRIDEKEYRLRDQYQQEVIKLKTDLLAEIETTAKLRIEKDQIKKVQETLAGRIIEQESGMRQLQIDTKLVVAELERKLKSAMLEETSTHQKCITLQLQLETNKQNHKIETDQLKYNVLALRNHLLNVKRQLSDSQRKCIKVTEVAAILEQELQHERVNKLENN